MIQAIKNPSFFRPASRPTSPAPTSIARQDSGTGADRTSRPLNKLSLGTFRRASPAPTLSPLPALTPLVQDGTYLETLSLKLGEAVSKALAQPTGPAGANEQVSGRRPLPAGRGHALGALLASELNATRDNSHLHRAILRCVQRPLSVLLTNVSAHLLPLLASPDFIIPPAPTIQQPNPNPTQLHALGLATLAGELLETFDELNLGLDGDPRGDGLKAIREALVSIVGRVVNPLVAGIRSELVPLITKLEDRNPAGSTLMPKAAPGTKPTTVQHPSIIALQAVMPIYAKALSRYTTSLTSQTTLATLLITLLWRGLVALSNRPPAPPSPPSSPKPTQVTLGKSRSSPGTPPVTPPSARFTMKLPPSRPASPPTAAVPSSTAADARALYDLLSILPRPAADKEITRLAREAVDEGLDGLKALATLLDAVRSKATAPKTEEELTRLTEDLPTLIAVPIILRAYVFTDSLIAGNGKSVASMLGLSEDEYRKGCLAGFGRAEECATAVCHRVLDVLKADAASSSGMSVAIDWMEAEIEP